MATTTPMNQTKTTLWAVAAEVAALPELATGWDSESDDAHLNYAMEWEELMNRLTRIHAQHAWGVLSQTELAAYERVIASLREYRDLAARLELPILDMLLDAPTRGRPA